MWSMKSKSICSAFPCRHRTGGEAARGDVKRDGPPVVRKRREREPDLADDLGPQVQRGAGIGPGGIVQRGQGLRDRGTAEKMAGAFGRSGVRGLNRCGSRCRQKASPGDAHPAWLSCRTRLESLSDARGGARRAGMTNSACTSVKSTWRAIRIPGSLPRSFVPQLFLPYASLG